MKQQYLRHYWSDNAGLIRAKVECNGDEHSRGIGVAYSEQAQCAMHRGLAPGAGIGAIGDLTLTPDFASYVRIPYRPNTYRVSGDMYLDGSPWSLCPRTFLKQAVQDAASMGWQIRAAFEPEFYLLQQTNGRQESVDLGLYGEPAGLDDHAPWMDRILAALEEQHVIPEAFHHEAGPGQYEIAIHHSSPVKAADDIITLRDTIKAISKEFGQTATFCPKPFRSLPGSGLHLNLSLWHDDRPWIASREDPRRLGVDAQYFISGILRSFDAVVAMTCPSINSHRRMSPGDWSGMSGHWNYADRDAAIRIPRSGNAPVSHLEFRTLDSTANPYLALGSIIHLGLDGIRNRQPMVAPGEMLGCFPTFEHSMHALLNHSVLADRLGPRLLRAYQAVRVSDFEYGRALNEDDESRPFILRY